jgi:hypothetical protein
MAKKILIGLLILGLIIIVSIVGYFYISFPKLISEKRIETISCDDTDGKDIYIKGEVTYSVPAGLGSQEIRSPDTCEYHPKYKNVLREGWCVGNIYYEIRTTCGFGSNCVDGRCT